MRVGFAGLGHMGLPMAARLAVHGFPLTVWNRTAGRAAPLAGPGVRVAGSPRDLAAASDVIITMLADGAAVRTVLGYKREAYPAAGSAPVSFTTALMAKDLELALGIATGAGLPLPVTIAARRFLDQACAEGFADADFACVAALVRGGQGGEPDAPDVKH